MQKLKTFGAEFLQGVENIRMASFVLVHGAYHGGWCYSRVVARLRAEGHDVHAPTLTGLGERAHLGLKPINLSTHIQDVVATIVNENLSDIILCGHSYAGMVITGVAGQVAERIRTLFYLDAAVPEDGQSAFDIAGPERTIHMLETAGQTGTMMVPPPASFFGVNAADLGWVDIMCKPHPIGCFIQKLHFTGQEARVPHRTYVLCQRYKSINHAAYAKVRNLPGWKAISVDRGHDLMIDDPDTLAELLMAEAARMHHANP